MTAYLQKLLDDNGLIEIRLLGSQTLSGIFDNVQDIRDAITASPGFNTFTSLNRPTDRTATNRLGQSACLANDDIAQITRLVFDFDPVRPTGLNSTAEELERARERAYGLAGYFHSLGWPEPLIACSGNGYHVQFRCKLPNDDQTKAAMGIIYKSLASRFSDDLVDFDTSVRNPGRIFRLYGTKNVKGPDTDDRPQRLAKGIHALPVGVCQPASILPASGISEAASQGGWPVNHLTISDGPARDHQERGYRRALPVPWTVHR